MQGPFAPVDCPHCRRITEVSLPLDATLMDVRKEKAKTRESGTYLGILYKRRTVSCPDGHSFDIVWTQEFSVLRDATDG